MIGNPQADCRRKCPAIRRRTAGENVRQSACTPAGEMTADYCPNFLYSEGVQPFLSLKIRLKAEILPKPDCRAASVMEIPGWIRSCSAKVMRFWVR